MSASPLPQTTHLLYLHGFRSSPQSAKAQRMARLIKEQYPHLTWLCPQLPPSPQMALAQVMQATADWPATQMAVIGSSLGGYYATWIAQQRGCRGVLLNPAVFPARDLARYIGEQRQFHQPEESFYFRPEYIGELQALDSGPLRNPRALMAVIAKGDEVLDWQEMAARYAPCARLLLEGSDHALSDFEPLLPALLQHLQLQPAPGHSGLSAPTGSSG